MTDMGTHVPLIASWPGMAPKGAVLDDLIDFTDFYTTFAQAAGVKLGDKDPIDGQSFLPQLQGKKGTPRDWVLCHYQPYWGKVPGQFARTQQYKLYRDGRFYDVPKDLKEEKNLEDPTMAPEVREALKALLKTAPPAPTEKGSAKTVERPTYPEWRDLND